MQIVDYYLDNFYRAESTTWIADSDAAKAYIAGLIFVGCYVN